MRISLLATSLVLTTLASVIICGLIALNLLLTARGPHQGDATIMIRPGTSIAGAGQQLTQAGVMTHPLLLRFTAKLEGGTIKAGEYLIPAQASVKDIYALLQSGEGIIHSVTIPEGLTSWEIVQLINAHKALEGKTITQIPTEGTLRPETWQFTRGETRQSLIDLIIRAQTTVLDEAWEKHEDNLPLKSKKEALILASIIEKETAVPEERRRVAGVFINRLRKGMKLQTDPTVIYGITKGKGKLERKLFYGDLRRETAWNTYVIPALPPTPICNPGKASIEAALDPEKHDLIFFVADGTGGHAFAKTLAEHNRNVAKWRKLNQ